ncbi:hypothetical protein MTO96_042755 [Rhipicephalus appendiculatus]
MRKADIAAAVSKAVSAALTTLDAKFETRFNTLQQAIADSNSYLNALKGCTEATNTSLNALKSYTESTKAEIHVRLERHQRSPNLPRRRRALNPQRLNHGASRTDRVAVELQGIKRSHLQQLVHKLEAHPQATEPAPDVIALQETPTP